LDLVLNPIAAVGRAVLSACREVGALALFALEGLSHLLRPPFYGRLFARHLAEIAYFSLPVVALTAIFTGMMLALQSYTGFARFNAEGAVANVVVLSITRELGPVIASLMVAGRIGASFAAEIGTMKVNEEIDALNTFCMPPIVFLALPRVIAATLVMPLLSIFSTLAGLLGGLVVLVSMNIPAVTYWNHVIASATLSNILLGLMKSGVFGLLVGLVGCSHGLQTERTADAVGRSATAAVVGSLVLITIFDGLFAVLFHVRGI
jgi:phospholipid/cholesterol/gamma-HCH transport system permease protein